MLLVIVTDRQTRIWVPRNFEIETKIIFFMSLCDNPMA